MVEHCPVFRGDFALCVFPEGVFRALHHRLLSFRIALLRR